MKDLLENSKTMSLDAFCSLSSGVCILMVIIAAVFIIAVNVKPKEAK